MAGTVVGPQRPDPEALARLAQRRLDPLEKALPPGSAGATAAEFLAHAPAPLGLRHPGARAGRVRDRRQRGADGCVVRGARRRARAAREDDDGPGPLGAAARRGRLGDHAGHAVAGAGGAGVRTAPGAAGERARRPGRHRGGEPRARRRSRAAGAVLGGLRVVRRRDGRRARGAAPRAPARRARRARRAGRAHGGPRPAGGARRGRRRGREPAPAPGRRRRLRGRAGPRRVAGRARPPSAATCATSPHCTPTSAGTYEADERGRHRRRQRLLRRRSPTSSARWPSPGPAVLLRSGAYVIHDDGFYRGISPLRPARRRRRCARPCTSGRASSPGPSPAWPCSTPASGTCPFDEGLPEPQLAADALGAPARPLAGRDHRASTTSTRSCACPPDTALDGRRRRPAGPVAPLHGLRQVAADPGGRRRRTADPVVVDLVRTYF